MATIADLEALGYTVGYAHGSVDAEEAALEVARGESHPDTVAAQAAEVTTMTVRQLDAEGRLPLIVDDEAATAAARTELAEKIAASALEGLTTRATDRVAFHEKALEIAQGMPTVWRVEQDVDGAVVLSLLVAIDDATGDGATVADAEALASLADPAAYAERVYQVRNPEATLAGFRAGAARPKPGEDVWEIDGQTFTAAALAAYLKKRAAPVSYLERVANVLASAPELSAKTRAAIAAALKGG